MRILWVKVGGLFPVNTGGRRRSFQIVSELSKRHEVVLLTTHEPSEEVGQSQRLLAGALSDCEAIESIPLEIPKRGSAGFALALTRSWLSPLPVDLYRCRSEALQQRLTELLAAKRFDLCVADFLAAMPNVPPLSETKAGGPPWVLFEHNVEHQIWKRMALNEKSPWRRALLEVEWRKLRRYEAEACGRVRRTVAVSEKDRAQLVGLSLLADVAAVPTGVDTLYFAPQAALPRPRELVFTGAMDWFPNEDGLIDFCQSTLPLVRAAVPDVSLTVVGRNPTARLREAAGAAGARVTGTVDDVRPYLAEAAVVIVPLRIGGGTRLKIFEALSMAKAVVSTTIGAEGLPVINGEHLVIADAPERFAGAIVDLLRRPERQLALGTAGRRLVEWQFAWPQVAANFEQLLTEVANHAH